jgi:hypothetical protein
MANSNFIVHNGLTVGPLTIDAATGSINTPGTVTVTGGLAVSTISKNDSSISINDTGTGSSVVIAIDGVTEHTLTATLTSLATALTASGNVVAGSGTTSTTTTTGALVVVGGAGVSGALNIGGATQAAAITSSGTIIASAVNAGTIGNSGATLTGTLSTAAQTNVTSVGTLTGLTVSGAIVPSANLTINVGSVSAWFNTFYGVSTQAKYADLAENYQADKSYNPGTVLMFGGTYEVTLADAATTAVAGVVSTNPAHLMNGQLSGSNVVPLALTGRVPCMVIGPVTKGDMMVSAGFGYAKSSESPQLGQVIGKALQDFPINAKGVIEVVVGRM